MCVIYTQGYDGCRHTHYGYDLCSNWIRLFDERKPCRSFSTEEKEESKKNPRIKKGICPNVCKERSKQQQEQNLQGVEGQMQIGGQDTHNQNPGGSSQAATASGSRLDPIDLDNVGGPSKTADSPTKLSRKSESGGVQKMKSKKK